MQLEWDTMILKYSGGVYMTISYIFVLLFYTCTCKKTCVHSPLIKCTLYIPTGLPVDIFGLSVIDALVNYEHIVVYVQTLVSCVGGFMLKVNRCNDIALNL